MRVIVTGNEGYLGTVLVPRLQAAGHHVGGIDSGLYRNCAVAAPPRVETLRRDVRDVGPEAFADADAVIHLAGLSNDPLGEIDAAATADINRGGTAHVAACARHAGVRRFVFASTCSVYGAAGEALIDEGAPTDPRTAYARSKLDAEGDLRRLAAPDFDIVVLRPGTVYGWSPRLRYDLVVNNLVAWAVASGKVRLKSLGRAWRPLVHVGDVAHAFAAALEAAPAPNGWRVLNVGCRDGNYRIIEVAQTIADALPGTEIEISADADHDVRSYRVDCTAIARALPAYRPAWDLQAGIAELHRHLAGRDDRPATFEGPALGRCGHLRALRSNGMVDASLRWVGLPAGIPA